MPTLQETLNEQLSPGAKAELMKFLAEERKAQRAAGAEQGRAEGYAQAVAERKAVLTAADVARGALKSATVWFFAGVAVVAENWPAIEPVLAAFLGPNPGPRTVAIVAAVGTLLRLKTNKSLAAKGVPK